MQVASLPEMMVDGVRIDYCQHYIDFWPLQAHIDLGDGKKGRLPGPSSRRQLLLVDPLFRGSHFKEEVQ